MATFLVKLLAVLLALSQVTTAPDAIKTQFDRTRDQEQVAGLLRAACMHMRKVFDIEGVSLDDLVSTAFDDPHATAQENHLLGSASSICTEPIVNFAASNESSGRPSTLAK